MTVTNNLSKYFISGVLLLILVALLSFFAGMHLQRFHSRVLGQRMSKRGMMDKRGFNKTRGQFRQKGINQSTPSASSKI
jgi:hypothetical protein